MENSRFTILLCNSAGEIDRREADTPEEARNMVLDIATGINDFHGGDTIKVIENE